MKKLLLFLIRFYRTQISPLTPPSCRFLPTCSEYAYVAVERFGPAKGSLLAAKRLAKCQPFHRQKSIEYDPVLEREPPTLRRNCQ
jgi:putative membrane protein insertion efficiency factor